MDAATKLRLAQVRIDGATQSRVAINQEVVNDYAEFLSLGGDLPAVTVFFDETEYWLADGFHRYKAHLKIGCLDIDVNVKEGTQRDAKLFAYGANQGHGLRRSAKDKRNAILGMLTDFSDFSDNKIAQHVGVDHKTVATQRASILGNSQDADRVRIAERNGKQYSQRTGNVGKSASKKPSVPSPDWSILENDHRAEVVAEEGDLDGTHELDPLAETVAEVSKVRSQLHDANVIIGSLRTEIERLTQRIAELTSADQSEPTAVDAVGCMGEQ